ncbi:MAG: TldD/PmbA family protein [Planctomycetes bacterium]|nr:TldD/PmbA family protein [Planctomycetota bacterium]
MIERILDEAARRADAAEVFSLETLTKDVGFQSGVLQRASEKETSAASLRVIAGGKLGHIAASRLDRPAELAEKAVRLAEFGEAAGFVFAGKASGLPALPLSRPQAAGLTLEAMIEASRAAVERVLAYDPGLKVGAGYGTGWERIRIRTTGGFEGAFERTVAGFGVSGSLAEEGNLLGLGKSVQGLLPPADPVKLADQLVEDFRIARRPASIPSGRHRVILAPAAFADVLMALLPAVDGKAVAKGLSPLKAKLGETVLDPRFTLRDDGLHPDGVCSQPFDDEGVPVRAKAVVERGVLKTFLTDLKSASMLKTASTGNAAREKPLERSKAAGAPPHPEVWNVIVDAGDLSYERMLRETALGLEIHEISGILLGNLINGDFSGTLEMAFLVRNGERVGRVKDAMVAGNFYELFRNRLVAFESDREWTGMFGGGVGSFLLPRACLADVDVTSK